MRSSSPYPVSSLWIRCSAAVQPVTSTAWMFASIRKAGFSSAGPVAKDVAVTSQMSRPSQEVPIDSSPNSSGASSAQERSSSVRSSYR
jgi:hypothetical protein